jgi:hypothetical protein
MNRNQHKERSVSIEDNPYLQQENYFEGYKEKIDALKQRPDVVELDMLCYMVFSTPDGKKLLEQFVERYLLPGFANPNLPNAGEAALYYEGFKEGFRLIRGSIKAHEQRIEAEKLTK